MKNTIIKIKNFKSIKDEISLEVKNIADKNCCILLGINESGKSNILEAISLLSDEQEVNYSINCNKQAQENENENISIIYEQQCDEHDNFKKELIKLGVHRNLANTIKITMFRREILINSKNEKHVTHTCLYETGEEEFGNYVVNYQDKRIEIITDDNFDRDDLGNTNILDCKQLSEFINNKSEYIIKDRFPKIIFWKPLEEKYLMNNEIDLIKFMSNPDTSIPLSNCFSIARIKDIEGKVSSAMDNFTQETSLKKLLSREVTQYINAVWKEHKINIKFEIYKGKIYFLVEEKGSGLASYDFNQRSIGFKHFISILLSLSVENKIGQLKNNIILLDEPEAHLHPSGQKFLRDELLRIAENNLVIFATHSVFMVDKKNLDRHFSIEKVNEVTSLSPIENDNLYKEEVLYKSLGTSILDHINENVLLFEGKTDRNIFDLYKTKFENEIKSPNLSLISADGCKKIIKYTKFFNTKLIKGFVLTDSDKPGQEAKNEVLETAKGYNKKNVFEINDILDTNKKSTLEDLFDPEFTIECVKKIYDLSINLDTSKPFIIQIKPALYRKNNKFVEKPKELKKAIYKRISKLEKKDLKKQKYFEFFKKLQKKLYDAPAN